MTDFRWFMTKEELRYLPTKSWKLVIMALLDKVGGQLVLTTDDFDRIDEQFGGFLVNASAEKEMIFSLATQERARELRKYFETVEPDSAEEPPW